ncbi:NADH dehydrogenase [ubiquinone] 1 beta subcomplex subunit 7 [Prorops nasuta]|uniref:NADH dehydrogenase [ubiquinone] 1 beta subcomplex subunit 7 n=1 Tax=Prorops nasuta TaxID=863751 RepID=UPI0034D013E1
MGSTMSNTIRKNWTQTDVTPDFATPSTFDPQLGFPTGRKQRVQIATEQEMSAMRLDRDKRDYCAHLFISFLSCRQNKFPFVYRCAPEKHQYEQCEFEDYVLRMKEYERERRLRIRTKNLREKQSALEQAVAA